MRLITLVFIWIGTTGLFGQADIPMDWNISFTESGKIGIYHPQKEAFKTKITVVFDGKSYEKTLDVEAQEWGFVEFPKDFNFPYESIPEGKGALKTKLKIEVGAEKVCEKEIFLSVRNKNQPYEVSIKEIADRINYYGDRIDDCLFYIDNKGYNYLIRSRNTKSPGIFLSHWVMDVSGKTEKINEYKDDLECMPGKVQTQYHSIGWMLEDANSDGYMEFYALIVNACEESDLHPQDATLVVFTNIPDLQLQGETYSLLKDDSENLGGKFEASAELQKQGEMLEKAEEAWENYIHETE